MYRAKKLFSPLVVLVLFLFACSATEVSTPTPLVEESGPDVNTPVVEEIEPPLNTSRAAETVGESENPLVGAWKEVAQISCESASERDVPNPIEELVFLEDGSIIVTWFPFEVYVDYVGTYTADEEGGMEIQPEELNYLPEEMDTVGTYEIDEAGRLVLRDMWLGVPPLDAPHPVNCGHIFEAG